MTNKIIVNTTDIIHEELKSRIISLEERNRKQEQFLNDKAFEIKDAQTWIVGIFLAIIILIIVAIIFYTYYMPHKVCYDEITNEKVFTGHWTNLNVSMSIAVGADKNDKYVCEDGVSIVDLRNIGTIWFNGYDKTCIIEHHKKVCEVK